jgi:hypothetical protein
LTPSCYGYLHLSTTSPTGFPAMIIDSGFNGDGNPIAIPTGAPTDVILFSDFDH